MKPLQIIPDKKAIDAGFDKQNEVLLIYENVVKLLQQEVKDMEEEMQQSGVEKDKIEVLEYWQLREELLLKEDALKFKRISYTMLLQRKADYEEAFERNSKICNDNFDAALEQVKKLNEKHKAIFEKYILAFEQSKQEILKDQELKNKFYMSIIADINSYK